MANFDNSAEMAIQFIRKYVTNRMDELNVSQTELAKQIGVNRSTLIRNLTGETEMTLSTFLKICGALELRPYLIPAENDGEMPNRIHFS